MAGEGFFLVLKQYFFLFYCFFDFLLFDLYCDAEEFESGWFYFPRNGDGLKKTYRPVSLVVSRVLRVKKS